jgi:hypothetical protein
MKFGPFSGETSENFDSQLMGEKAIVPRGTPSRVTSRTGAEKWGTRISTDPGDSRVKAIW